MDPLMRHVAATWADVMGLDPQAITHTSDFFALGGNSLLCGKMNSRIRSELQVSSLSGMLIYQATTLAEFTQAVAVAGAVLPAAVTGTSTPATLSSSSSSRPQSVTSDDEPPSLGRTSSNDLSDLQAFIAEAWADALGCKPGVITEEDDFFALGGNSLLCGKMNSRIRSGLNLPSMSGMLIYHHPSLGGFTEAVAVTGAILPSAYGLSSSSSSSSSAGPSRSSSGVEGLTGHQLPGAIPEAELLSSFIAAAWAETLGVESSSLTAGEGLALQRKCLCSPGLHVAFADTCQNTLQKPCDLTVSSQITQALIL
jgi:hypothetical protein